MSDRRPRRRWLSMSLRASVLGILALAVWLGWWVNSARDQQAAVTAVRTAPYSANVIYDDDPEYWAEEAPLSRRITCKMKSWVPAWFKATLGQDYFYNALAITFSKDPVGSPDDREVFRKLSRVRSLDQLNPEVEIVDADVAEITQLSNLKRLSLRGRSPRLTEASFRTLARMPHLASLEVLDAPVTDAWFTPMQRMRALKSLTLGESDLMDIKGNGLAHLADLPALTTLQIASPSLTGEGLRQIGAMKNLQHLSVRGGSFTDDDLRFLAPLVDLDVLEIMRTGINGTGFRHLTGLKKIKYVDLESPEVSDAAIPFLASLHALEDVQFVGTRVTASGLEGFRVAPCLTQMALVPAVTGDTKRLKQALPRCNILSGGSFLR